MNKDNPSRASAGKKSPFKGNLEGSGLEGPLPEKLLHYAWRHKLLPITGLHTSDGRTVEVLNPGIYNRQDAGPDFFNAKVKVDGLLWVGNVELHVRASDWYRHRHDSDPAYDNVILHVVCDADMDVTTSKGNIPPTLVISMPLGLEGDYQHLINTEKYPPCYEVIPSLPPLKVHAWMSALQTERLERKTIAIEERVKEMGGSWDDAYFATLAHNFGFGINGEAFDEWARRLPLRAVDHHRDDLFQVETLFIGTAGLLNRVDDKYAKEYSYMQKKFRLDSADAPAWRYLRTRPQNFPHVRIMQLARMYHERRTSLSALIDCPDVKSIGKLYNIKGTKLALVIINTVVPMLFAYGRAHANEQICDRAFDLLAALKAEDNHIVRMWQECGLDASTAGDSQALIQLKNEYCDKKDCLRCRFGYEFLSGEHRNNFFHDRGPSKPPLKGGCTADDSTMLDKFENSGNEISSEKAHTSPKWQKADEFEYNLLHTNAHENRNTATDAEALFWEYAKGSGLGVKCRRQYIIGQYIVDFFFRECNLIVELDGGYHNAPEQQEQDRIRQHWLEEKGYKVLRFTNDEVFKELNKVIEKIKSTILQMR